MSNFVSQYQKL